jgi:Tfp pilus assembly protein PilO
MDRSLLKMLPRKNMIVLLGILGLIVIFIFLWILPAKHSAEALETEIESLSTQIEEQKILQPAYKSLYKKAQMKLPKAFSSEQPNSLPKGDTNQMSAVFAEMASNAGLRMKAFNPDVASLIDESDRLLVNVELQGSFFDFYNFINELCQLPYLQNLETLNIVSTPDTKAFKLKIWLSQD